LRVEISNHIYSNLIVNIDLFSKKSRSFIAWVCPLLKTLIVTKGSTLYEEGDDIYSIYFTTKNENKEVTEEGSIGFVLKKYNNVKYVQLD